MLMKREEITFWFSTDAVLNENAEIGLPGNENTAYLEFSNNPNGEGTGRTKEDTVIVFTYELDGEKVDGEVGEYQAGRCTVCASQRREIRSCCGSGWQSH